MLKVVIFLALFCLLEVEIILGANLSEDFQDLDIYKAVDIDGFSLADKFKIKEMRDGRLVYTRYEDESAIDRLNNLLVERTESAQLETNFNVILEELLLEYKNKVNSESESIKAKRLVLALQTLEGGHLCDRYGYLIIKNNGDAIRTLPSLIKNMQNLRRIDKIFAHYINERIENCLPTYLKKYDDITAELDHDQIKHLDFIVGDLVARVKTDASLKIPGENDAEKFFKLIKQEYYIPTSIGSAKLYDMMKELAKDDEDVKYLVPIENERTGKPTLVKDKFNRIFNEYLTKPCRYFREQLKHDVFNPMEFDVRFGHELRKDRLDFYEAWYKYFICGYLFDGRLGGVSEYASNLKDNSRGQLKKFPGFLQ